MMRSHDDSPNPGGNGVQHRSGRKGVSLLSAALLIAAGLSATVAGGLVRAPSAQALTPTLAGSYQNVTPARVLDTRKAIGAPARAVRRQSAIAVTVTGSHGVPATGVSAVVLNLTVTTPSSGGYLTAYGYGSIRPVASTLNFSKHQTVANLAIVPVGAGGRIALYNGSAGTAHFIADISGYYLSGAPTSPGSFAALSPARVLDTRKAIGAPLRAIGRQSAVTVKVTGTHGVPVQGVSAVVLNITVTTPTSNGFVTAYDDGGRRPVASTLNFVAGQTVANLAIVPVGADGRIVLYNGSAGRSHFIADVAGYYLAGAATAAGAFKSMTPVRALDTRKAIGAPAARVSAHRILPLLIAGTHGVPATGVSAVVINLTAVAPTAGGYLTAFAHATTTPVVSNLNFVTGQTVPNLAVIPLGADGRISLLNGSGGSVHLLVDISGYYLNGGPVLLPPQVSPAPVSTSHYPRSSGAFRDLSVFTRMGAADAPFNPAGHSYLVLMDVGGQYTRSDGLAGVLLSATSTFIAYPDLVAGMKAYLDGYASKQHAGAPVTVAIGTNNDVDVSAATGKVWADQVIDPLAAYAARYPAITVAGADDMEPGFSANQAETQSWLRGYLANTTARFVFNGSADGCPQTQRVRGATAACNNGWTNAGLYLLSGGLAPNRILSLPQIYFSAMPLQWQLISVNGVITHQPRINFVGTLTEFDACAPATQACSSMTGTSAWTELWNAINSDSRTAQASLPSATDLRIN